MFIELNNLKLFFEQPEREFHLRELARILKKNPVTVQKHLEPFVKQGVISRRNERNLELYSSNTEDFYYKQCKISYNKFKLIDSKLPDELKNRYNMPTIVMFGSYSKGEDNENSDVDICVLSEIKSNINLSKYEKKLNRSIQLHKFNKKEWNSLKSNNPGLVNSIINGIVLHGFLEVL